MAAKLLMWQKQQDAKKSERVEYGSARWGDRDDIQTIYVGQSLDEYSIDCYRIHYNGKQAKESEVCQK